MAQERTAQSPATHATKLAARAQEQFGKVRPTPKQRVPATVDFDKDDVCIIIPKEQLIHEMGPGGAPHGAQQGVHLAIDGTFEYRTDGGKRYTLRLRSLPWVRLDVVAEES